MKAQLTSPLRKSKVSIAISIAVHIGLFAGLAAITFHYPLDTLFRREPTPVQTLRYVRVAPEPPPTTRAADPRRGARRAVAPAPIVAPTSIPVDIPAPSTAPAGVAVASGRDTTQYPGIAAGLRPGIPDPRLSPSAVVRAPLTEGQRAERALTAIYEQYLDSARAAMEAPKGRAPGDWSWGGKDGTKWGWDQAGIRIGGITIPNAVLAALPLNIGPQGRNMNALIDGRNDTYMRADIKMHSNLMTEDEFRSAVRRIRERVDRERQEKLAKARPKTPPCCQ